MSNYILIKIKKEMKKVFKLFGATVLTMFLFASANAQDINSAGSVYNSAATALKNGKTAEALTGFQKALSMAQSLGDDGASLVSDCKGIIPKLILQTAKDAVQEGNYSNAETKIKQAYESAKKYNQPAVMQEAKSLLPKVIITGGDKFLNAGKMNEAAAEYRKALKEDSTNVTAYMRLGMATFDSNETESIKAFGKAADLGSKDEAMKQLSNLYFKKGYKSYKAHDYKGALQNCLKADSYSDNKQACKMGGMIALKLKKYPDAVKLLQKIDGPGKFDIKYSLAMAYEAMNDKTKACGYYKQIVSNPRFKAYAQSKISTLCK